MFRALLPADVLSDYIAVQRAIVAEAKWRVDRDGIHVTAVDPANVGMIDTTLAASGAEAFEADPGTLGIDLERLADVIGMADSDDLVELELDEQTRTLEIHIDGLDYSLALIDPDSIRQEPDLPDLELPATIVLPGEQISRGVDATALVSDHASLRADADAGAFHIAADGDTDDVDLELTDELLSAQVADSRESLFSLEYLSDIEQEIPSDAEVSVLLGSEMPVKLQYSIADGHVSVVNLLAPRIESS